MAQHTAFKGLIATLCVLVCTMLAFGLPGQSAYAQDQQPRLVAELMPDVSITLDGETLTAEVSKDANGGLLVRAEPIFKALNDDFEYNLDEGVLVVHRSQDGVKMELFTDTGIVKANGKALGKLKVYGEVAQGSINLTPNAIAVLSGAAGKFNEKERRIDFELDPRLKVATGFEVFVNDIPLGHVDPGPKSIGSVLLLPLRPIAEELGHDIQLLDGGSSVKIRRSQDSAEFELNLATGLVKLNGRPYGVTPDVTYIDEANLLLPVSALETLTGTHVKVEAGTARIDVTLDSRLEDVVKPGERIDAVTDSTPFTVETLDFHVGPDTLNTANLDFRVKGINGRIRLETQDLPTKLSEMEPSWLSLDYAHVKGGYGSLGDYSADLRELDGTGVRRIRGVSYAKVNEDGRWALTAGVPANGVKVIENSDQTRLTYGGFAAGARYADRDGWEAGLAVSKASLSDDQMAVLSAISGRLGRKRDKKLNWDGQAYLGVFDGPARQKPVDVRLSLNGRYEINKNVNVDGFVSYDGSEFLRGDLDGEARRDAILEDQNPDQDQGIEDAEEDNTPDIRIRGRDNLNVGVAVQVAARTDIGPFERPAASARLSQSKSGFLTGSENSLSLWSVGATVSSRVKPFGTNLSADFTTYNQTDSGETSETGDQITVRAYQNTEYATGRVQYSSFKRNDDPRDQRIDAQITAKPLVLPLSKDGTLSISPSLAGSWALGDTGTNNSDQIRGGVVANLNSGKILGDKTKLTATLGVLQNFSGNTEKNSDTFLSVALGRKLPINKNMALSLAYRNDLRGEQRFGVHLDGRFDFNEKRKFKQSKDGRGVLKGRAFLDQNRDGVKQEDEPGIRGAVVRIKGTRMSLRTDSAGYFTIQNIKEGLHELQVDGRSLALGYALAEDISTKASIREGHITDVQLPIVQRGQITGFTYVDLDGDGEYSKGETRIEGAKLVLQDMNDPTAVFEARSASFGQYAFDDLPASIYEIRIEKTNAPNTTPSEVMIVDLASADDLITKINLAAISATPMQMAEQNPADTHTVGKIPGREEDIPAPDPPPEVSGTEPAP